MSAGAGAAERGSSCRSAGDGDGAPLHLVRVLWTIANASARQACSLQCSCVPRRYHKAIPKHQTRLCARRGVLSAEFFGHMRRGSYVVNVSRGAHVVDTDLLAALDSGQVRLFMFA